MLFSQVGIAIPTFWISILLVLLFAVQLRWVPPGGFPGWDELELALRSLILSATLVQSAVLARVTRSSVLEVLRLDFVRTAWAKGLSQRRALRGHVLRNALIPVVTIIELQVGSMVTGTIVIENVFYLPELGRLVLVDCQSGCFCGAGVGFVFYRRGGFGGFLVDVAYVVIDPRLQDRLELGPGYPQGWGSARCWWQC